MGCWCKVFIIRKSEVGPFYISLLETNKSVMFNLILNWSSWQCLNISSDVSPDPSLKRRRSSNRAALIPFGWFIESSSTPPRRPLLIPLPNASTTPPSSSAKLHHRQRRCRTRNKDILWPWKCFCSAIPRVLLENYAAGWISFFGIFRFQIVWVYKSNIAGVSVARIQQIQKHKYKIRKFWLV